MLRELLQKLNAFRLVLLVSAGALMGATSLGWYWYDRPATALIATYKVLQLTPPHHWRLDKEKGPIDVLSIRIDKVWAKKIVIDQVLVRGVGRIDSVTVWAPDVLDPAVPSWSILERRDGAIRTGQISKLPPLLAGSAFIEVYVWGKFAPYPYLEVSIQSTDGHIDAEERQTYSPTLVFIARNAGWFALILCGGLIAGAFVYVDKRKGPSVSP